MSRIPGHRDELDEAMGGIIVKPIGVGERDDAVWVGRERGVAACVEAHVTAVGVDEARCVQTVAAHHAANSVGDQLCHSVLAEAGPLLLFGELAAVAVGGVHREGDLLDGDIGGEFVLQAVSIDEEAVVLLFEALHLGDGFAVLSDPGGVAGFEWWRVLGGRRQDGEGLEVPGAFVSVPVDSVKNRSTLTTFSSVLTERCDSGGCG